MDATYLKDYVWMRPPGDDPDAKPEKVPTSNEDLSAKLAAGWSQCDPPEED